MINTEQEKSLSHKIVNFILLFVLLISYVQASELEKVSLKLQRKYQLQFAVFIIVKERGFYEEVRPDIELLEYNNTNTIEELVDGKVDFTINNSIVVYVESIRKIIKKLRKKLPENLIENVQTLGYKLNV